MIHYPLVIAIDSIPAGLLGRDDSAFYFCYFAEYIRRDQCIPVSLCFSMKAKPQAFKGVQLPPFFVNILPEGWLFDVARHLKLDMQDPLRLLASLCRDNIGAVEVFDMTGLQLSMPSSEDAEATPIGYSYEHLARKISAKKSAQKHHHLIDRGKDDNIPTEQYDFCVYCHKPLAFTGENSNLHPSCCRLFYGCTDAPGVDLSSDNLLDLARSFLSDSHTLTGVQAKLSTRLAEVRSTIASNEYIIKPEPSDIYYKDLAKIEAITMHFAASLGIATVESIFYFSRQGLPLFITKRFDRGPHGKVHMEDFAQILGKTAKYEGSIESIFAAIKRHDLYHCQQSLRQAAMITLFNFLVGNADNHLKNLSMVHYPGLTGDIVSRLAPAYDLIPARIFATGDDEQAGLTLAGKKKNIRKDHFIQLFQKNDLTVEPTFRGLDV